MVPSRFLMMCSTFSALATCRPRRDCFLFRIRLTPRVRVDDFTMVCPPSFVVEGFDVSSRHV